MEKSSDKTELNQKTPNKFLIILVRNYRVHICVVAIATALGIYRT